MAVTSFSLDDKLDKTVEQLKNHYGASSKAEIFRKAIALLQVVQENEQQDGSIIIRNHRNQDMKVLIR